MRQGGGVVEQAGRARGRPWVGMREGNGGTQGKQPPMDKRSRLAVGKEEAWAERAGVKGHGYRKGLGLDQRRMPFYFGNVPREVSGGGQSWRQSLWCVG